LDNFHWNFAPLVSSSRLHSLDHDTRLVITCTYLRSLPFVGRDTRLAVPSPGHYFPSSLNIFHSLNKLIWNHLHDYRLDF
jgi:hypothetical protein